MAKNVPPCPEPNGGWTDNHNRYARAGGYDTWAEWTTAVQDQLGRPICGGIKHKTKEPCRGRPTRGRARCRMHGGNAPYGPASPHFKHGLKSKYVPKDLLADYESAYNDPEYLSMRKQIAVNEAREAELLRDLSDNSPRWRDLERVSTTLTNAVVSGDMGKAMEASTEISELIAAGRKRGDIWQEVERCQEHGKKLKTAEAKILKDRDMTLDKDRALALFLWLVGLLRQKITDRHLLADIATDIRTRVAMQRPMAITPVQDVKVVE